jgi:hypothetical protein
LDPSSSSSLASLFFRSASALQDISLTIVEQQYTAADTQLLGSVLQVSQSLRRLTLCVENNAPLYAAMLSSLQNVRTLLELRLLAHWSVDEAFFDALSQYLRSTRTLQRIGMENFNMEGAMMTSVLSGLRYPNEATGLPTTFVSSLEFLRCTFDRQAQMELIAFLRTATTSSSGEILCESFLREFHLYDNRRVTATPTESVMALEGLLSPPDKAPTVGSLIHTLSLENAHPDFFAFGSMQGRLQVQTLKLNSMSAESCKAFCMRAPDLSALLRLNVTAVDPRGLHWIVRGLKANGSICEVTTRSVHNEEGGDFNPTQKRLIEAICKRNQQLSTLIGSEPRAGDEEGDDVDEEAIVQEKLQLRVPLLQVTQQVPSNRTSMLIRGLLSLGQCVK